MIKEQYEKMMKLENAAYEKGRETAAVKLAEEKYNEGYSDGADVYTPILTS